MGLSLGSCFGPHRRYELGEPVGVGGSAVVHRVHDRHRGVTLAGKFAFATPDGFAESALQREGAMLARLRHESIVALVDSGCDGEAPYLLLEYAAGQTLAAHLAQARPSALQATRILIDITAGLAHAHHQGILHLDIKPSNIILLPTGRAKIIDFGAGSVRMDRCQWSEAELAPRTPIDVQGISAAAFVKGTLHYMAPEQWILAPSHPSMDVWAAGMLYYELLTGQLPFGSQPTCLRLRSSQSERVPFSSVAHGVPQAVEDIVAHTLTRDPNDRFASAIGLLDALARVEASLALAKSA